MPAPRSATESRTPPLSGASSISIVRAAPEYLIALSSRFASTWPTASRSAHARASAPCSRTSTRKPSRSRRTCERAERLVDDGREVDRLEAQRAAAALEPREVEDVVDEAREARALRLDRLAVLAQLLRIRHAAHAQELAEHADLAAAGVSAVVGMQGNVAMKTADAFAAAFFEALANDGIVDRAMAEARRSVADRDDWWAPVLFSRLRSGRTYYRPEFASRGEATWQTLGLQIRTGNFTPVLGPGLADGILGSRQDIARGFVERWQMPLARHSQGDLAQVAQYLRVRSAEGTVRAQLFDYLATEIAKRRDAATGPGRPLLGARARPPTARPVHRRSRAGACARTIPVIRTASWPSCPSRST